MTPPAPWNRLSAHLAARFGGRVRKVALDAGLGTCPNRDGTAGHGGCAWCDPGGSGPDGPERGLPWEEVLRTAAAVAARRGETGVVAYFQAYTPTYAPPAALEAAGSRALAVPGVVGLAVGARPDCLSAGTLNVLQALAERTLLWVELGMQSAHDDVLRGTNRGHNHAATVRAAAALRKRGLRTVLHLIAGLPGEAPERARASFSEAARLSPCGVKLHPLHIVSGAPLEESWRRGAVPLLSLEEYARLAADLLERLPPETLVHRLTGERPAGILLAPSWCAGKRGVLAAVAEEISRRGTRQGSRWLAESPEETAP